MHSSLADTYLSTLLDGRRQDAARLVLDAIERGALTIEALYLEVFEPVLVEVGRRWQHNQLSIAEEHYVSAATQQVMAQLYPRIFTAAPRGLTMVAACVGPELHEIGLRMVADLFELDGWNTYYLGANVPAAAIVGAVRSRRAHLLALSTALDEHVEVAREVIARLREDPVTAEVPVLVGGHAFRDDPERWRAIGASAAPVGASEVVQVARRLVGGRGG
ncbi:MAG: cobalamin-dependent protein [Nannocystaceae bacterium]